MGRGGGLHTEWGACGVLPLRTGGAEKVSAMMKGGGHKRFWGSFCMIA